MYQMVLIRKKKMAERLCSPPCIMGSWQALGLVVQTAFIAAMAPAGCCGQGWCRTPVFPDVCGLDLSSAVWLELMPSSRAEGLLSIGVNNYEHYTGPALFAYPPATQLTA